VITLIHMAAQFCGSTNLNGPHHTLVTNGHLMTLNLSIGRPKGPKEIGHF
jgi:hypothetical protein